MGFDLAYDYESFFAKDPTLKKSDIAELKTWVQGLDSGSTVPKDMTDKQLLVFHLACERVTVDTKKCIKSHYNMRDKHPEHFDNRDPMSDVLKEAQEVQEYMYLPATSDKGYGIMLHRLHDFTVERYNYSAGSKFSSMIYESIINESGPYNGIILLFDLRGAKFGHVTRVSIGYMAKFMAYVQEGLNGRIDAIHIFNVVPLFDKIMKLLKPFMKGELIKRMVLHPPDMDWEVFYRDVLPRKCLPSDFGGDLPDTQTIQKQNIERVLRNKDFFEAEEKQRHLYSKSNKKKSNVESNFTHLDID